MLATAEAAARQQAAREARATLEGLPASGADAEESDPEDDVSAADDEESDPEDDVSAADDESDPWMDQTPWSFPF